MHCPVCNSQIKREYIFCPNCGAVISIYFEPNYQSQTYEASKIDTKSKQEIINKINQISEKRSFLTKLLLVLSIFSIIFFFSFLCFSYMFIQGYGRGGIGGLITGFFATVISIIFSLIMLIIIRQIDVYEKEPWGLIFFSFAWGALGATIFSLFANEINNFIFTYIFGQRVGNVLTAIISAPIFEEFFKLLVIPIIIIFFRTNFNSPLDGIVYIFSSSLGFKIVEDLVYGAKFTSQAGPVGGFLLLFLVRWLLGFLGHPLLSMFSGFAIGLATITPNYLLKILYVIMGYILSMSSHLLWNFMASVGIQWLSYFACLFFPLHITISIIIFIILYFIALNIDKKILKESLIEDISNGFLSHEIIEELTDLTRRARKKTHIPKEKRKIYDIFMSELASYALLKRQSINTLGQEIKQVLQQKREILEYLKPYVYS